MEYIDNHCHILAADQQAYPLAPLGGKQSTWASERPLTAEQMLAAMDANGIDQAVLVQATTAYGYDNSYVLDSATRWPNRFVAVGTFDPLVDNAATRLAASVASGLSGVRLFTVGSTLADKGDWFADRQTREFWNAAAQLGITVCLQTRLSESYEVIEHLLTDFPDVRVLLDHCGYPDVKTDPAAEAEKLGALAKHPNLYLKLTHRTLEPLAEIGSDAVRFLEPLVASFGASRIAWGTNVPAAEKSHSELLKLANSVLRVLLEEDRVAIFASTTRSLYRGLRAAE